MNKTSVLIYFSISYIRYFKYRRITLVVVVAAAAAAAAVLLVHHRNMYFNSPNRLRLTITRQIVCRQNASSGVIK